MKWHILQGAMATLTASLPPNSWMWKTTPAPPPGPYPQVVWVEHTAPPVPTTPPAREACYGCDCLFLFADDLIKGGSIASDFTCGSKHIAPTLNWSGTPKNSGVGHPLLQPDGTECPRCQSFALVVEDMDYPHGVGQGINSVKTHFWAVNIPGDWSNFNDEMASKTYKDLPMAVVGKNDFDDIGLTPMCPSQGVHRYRTTLWALRGYLGSEQDPISPDTPYSQILPQLEQLELARSSFYGNVKGKPKVGFLSVKESL